MSRLVALLALIGLSACMSAKPMTTTEVFSVFADKTYRSTSRPVATYFSPDGTMTEVDQSSWAQITGTWYVKEPDFFCTQLGDYPEVCQKVARLDGAYQFSSNGKTSSRSYDRWVIGDQTSPK